MAHLQHTVAPHFILKDYQRRWNKAVVISASKNLALSIVLAGAILLILNGGMWLALRGRTPLFLSYANTNLGMKPVGQAQAMLADKVSAKTFMLNIEGQAFTTTAKQAGVGIDGEASLAIATQPHGWERLPMVQALRNRNRQVQPRYTINPAKLETYLQGLKPPATTPAKNAALVIPETPGQAAYIQASAVGKYFDSAKAANDIANTVTEQQSLVVNAVMETQAPQVSTTQLAAELEHTNKLLSARPTIKGAATYTLTAQDMHSIVVLKPNKDLLPEASLDQNKLLALLRTLAPKYYIAPGTSKVERLNGQTVSSTSAAQGRALDTTATLALLTDAITKGTPEVAAVTKAVDPSVQYVENYTHDNAGMAAFIQAFVASHGGTIRVATAELTGDRFVYFNANSTMPMASVYKLFVSYVALRKVEQGSLSLNTQTGAGTIDSCIQRMIIVSDNACGIALLDLMGWDEVDSVVHAAGFGGTRLNNSGGTITTAANVASYLNGLYNHTLLNAAHSDYIINLMKQNIYRSGIPAGSPGATVADKVGFLGSTNADAGIVYGPNTTYLLVILTTGSDFSAIKALAAGLYALYS